MPPLSCPIPFRLIASSLIPSCRLVSGLILGGVLALAPACAALAETLRGAAQVTAVTLYPEGASVTRAVTLDAPAGQHRLVLPGLPAGTDADSLRIAATGAQVAGVSVQTDRALPPDLAESPAVTAARAEVERLERALRERDAAIAAIRARAEAANETIAFLRDLAKSDGVLGTDIATLAASVQAQILAAKQEALRAGVEAAQASVGRERLIEDLERAREALAAVDPEPGEGAALVIDLAAAGGPVTVETTTLAPEAGWRPVYDARLDRAAGTLLLERGVVVRQATGEDWNGVRLTLSTARPAEGAMPSELFTEIVRIEPEDRGRTMAMAPAPMAAAKTADLAGGMAEAEAVTAAASFDGLTLVFDYPRPVDVRSGADALRLALDSVPLTSVAVRAEAVPRLDSRATLVAEAVNGRELILPGTATLYSGAVMMGRAELPTTAAGDKLRLGFGPVDGLTVERRIEDATEGDRGLIAQKNSAAEVARLIVKNLTDESWPLRIVDQVPVSEQEDLVVRWSADPSPTATDPEGRRGILHWDGELAAGATREIVLTTILTWPKGQQLLR